MKNDMKKLLLLIIAIVGVAIFSGAASAATLDKTTVMIRTSRTFDARDSSKYGWLPEIDFRVNGPIAKGSVLSVELTTPDGKPWLAFDCKTYSVGEGEVMTIEGCGRDVAKDKFTAVLGNYSLKIDLKNELQGTGQALFSGKFKVGKAFVGAVPQDKTNWQWYADYDWALPIAEVFPLTTEESYGGTADREAQPLVATFWFRGDPNETDAYLYYNGKQIAKVGHGNEQGIYLFDRMPFSWTKKRFTFNEILVFNTETNGSHAGLFRMDKNPGEYEIKVLRHAKLVRTAKFTVGADGKIVDNGVTKQNELGTGRMTVFANVLGDEEGRQPDLQAWKSSVYFGGALQGFGQ